MDDLFEGEPEASHLDRPLASSNVGFQLLIKMGWKAGAGLGREAQGRVEPVPFIEKKETMGLGRMNMELEMVSKVTEVRKLLKSEVALGASEEKLQKWKDESERKDVLQAQRKEASRVFFCEVCNKQYNKVGYAFPRACLSRCRWPSTTTI
eukprot:m.94121 g.94121  ORF g.94121 m.94121 type:complete len:151 (+) comp13842_c3_seq1:78-530(+)